MTWTLHNSDCLEGLRQLPDNSVQTCVTSPPYWGLRDYGTATWEGGDPTCQHDGAPWTGDPGDLPEIGRNALAADAAKWLRRTRGVCRKCGAARVDEQLGLEPTPEEYVEHLVEVFREVRRVLRPDGTLWLNLGDSYASRPNGSIGATTLEGGRASQIEYRKAHCLRKSGVPDSLALKHKDLVGIPWRTAFALQADGWYLRSDIVWHKPNPMPESVTDRPTKSHEYLFLMAKNPRYYYDAEAIKEEATMHLRDKRYAAGAPGRARGNESRNQQGPYKPHKGFKSLDTTHGRNRRSVWTVATRPFPEAHFATFPPGLVEPCILAGSRPGDIVLDPFAGAGTTLLVAERHGRDSIGFELNPDYCGIIRRRLSAVQVVLDA